MATTRSRLLAASCAALALLAGQARGEEIDNLARRVAKYATAPGGMAPRYPCVCQDGSERHARAGYTIYTVLSDGNARKIGTFCSVFEFAPSGDAIGGDVCSVFVSLAK